MEFNEHMQIMQILEIQILWLPYHRGYYILISFWLSLHDIGFASFLFILFSLPQNGQENIFTQHTYQRLHNFLSKSRTYHMKCGSTKLLLCMKVLSYSFICGSDGFLNQGSVFIIFSGYAKLGAIKCWIYSHEWKGMKTSRRHFSRWAGLGLGHHASWWGSPQPTCFSPPPLQAVVVTFGTWPGSKLQSPRHPQSASCT